MRVRAFVTAMALGAVAVVAVADAQADVIPGITNGDFSTQTGSGVPGTNSDSFNNVAPTGWTSGNSGPGGSLIFITNYAGVNNPSVYLQVYGGVTAGLQASTPNNPFPDSPLHGNFVEADGNPYYGNSFSYQLSGLTVGKTYSLSFYEAFGQQTNFSSASTNQWIVGLGVAGSQFVFDESNSNQYTYSYSDSYAASHGGVTTPGIVSVPNEGVSPWQQVTVNLTADATNDVLTFLAWANGGSTVNVPPIAFLDIADNGAEGPPTATPAPASLTMLLTGMIGIGAFRLRRRANLAMV